MKSQDIRKAFLAFFEKKKHQIVASAPLVIKDDPTLMFTNAGMNQFKEYFLGNGVPKSKRIADSQKCLRVSGKHNDLEEVGMDTYHHTMFEMLGNWSFGDYFKKEAIAWAWEFLTEEMQIDKNKLYVTVFEGSDDKDNLKLDTEAYNLWKQFVPEDRILMGNKKDNFWEMGEQGPCGPCSEIHVDIRSDEEKKAIDGKDLVNQDHPQVVEIWNLVFMQYNRKANGTLEKLPEQHVDTGMGFERLCMVKQDVQSNYDTDVFTPLIREIETITNSTYGKKEETDIAIRVIADHIRAIAFAIADGQLPSNTGAGYVIRRILRRAVRYGFTFLDTKEPFIFRIAVTLANQMGDAFPELKKQRQLIENVVREEETSFLRTLDQGLVLLERIIANTKGKEVSGKKAFELFDTYGFPVDLTALILRERGMTLNEVDFKEAMKAQKERSRAAAQIATEDWVILKEDEDEEFVGYDLLEANVRITKYRKVTSKKDGELFQLVFNMTPFYPEGGGQVGDKGYLEAADANVTYIIDTKKENNLIIHFSKTLPKELNQPFKAVVDSKQRFRSACNHSATHLLHQALRVILGEHVEQKGSAVHSGYLRFDFSHFAKLTNDELKAIENFVNARIREAIPLEEHRNIPFDKALEKGALALFGEKYDDAVRMIGFGQSKELCGGTHVKNTSEIWQFKIRSESAIASGVRRIEAITNDACKAYYQDNNRDYYAVKALLNNAKDPKKAILKMQEELASLKKQVEKLTKDKAKSLKGDLINKLEEINGVKFLAIELDLDANAIKDLLYQIGNEIDKLYIVAARREENKALLSAYVSKSVVSDKGLNAGTIVRELGKYIQGGGGGQPFFATAGGKNPNGIAEALEKAKDFLN
jgi:alanyl-tRNA synthetase